MIARHGQDETRGDQRLFVEHSLSRDDIHAANSIEPNGDHGMRDARRQLTQRVHPEPVVTERVNWDDYSLMMAPSDADIEHGKSRRVEPRRPSHEDIERPRSRAIVGSLDLEEEGALAPEQVGRRARILVATTGTAEREGEGEHYVARGAAHRPALAFGSSILRIDRESAEGLAVAAIIGLLGVIVATAFTASLVAVRALDEQRSTAAHAEGVLRRIPFWTDYEEDGK